MTWLNEKAYQAGLKSKGGQGKLSVLLEGFQIKLAMPGSMNLNSPINSALKIKIPIYDVTNKSEELFLQLQSSLELWLVLLWVASLGWHL